MFNLKFVLVAILVFLACAMAQSLQGEALSSDLAESKFEEEGKVEKRWRWGKHDDDDDDEDDDEDDRDSGNNGNSNGDGFEFTPCQPVNGGSTVRPTSAPSTAPTTRPSTAPTTRPSTAPTTRPSTAPTTRPSTAPTTRPTSAPATQKPTERPTQRPTSSPATQRPTSPATQKPTSPATQKPTERPTQRPTSSPATQKPTERPTQKPTSPATQRPTSAPVTQKPTSPPSGGNYGSCDIVPGSAEPVKMLLPLYNYPDSSWDQVAAGASKIDIIAIINPSSGPGSASGPGTTYTNAMNKLNTAGVEQIGYVHTSYGSRSISDVKKEIDIYANGKFPHVVGIFFDEASNDKEDIPYYRELYNYVLAKGYRHSILNPGTSTDEGYVTISTNIVIYETSGSKISNKNFGSWVKCASNGFAKAGYKYKFSGMAHSVSSTSTMSSIIDNMHSYGMGMVFVTDGAEGCCTYNKMAGFFATEVTAIQSLNKK